MNRSAKGLGVYITIDLGNSVSVCRYRVEEEQEQGGERGGKVLIIHSLSVAWWQSPVRTYNYVISVSSNNVTFTQVNKNIHEVEEKEGC